MAEKMNAKKKKLFIFGGIGAAVIAAVVVVLLLTGVLTHSALYRQLAADGTATIEINEDIEVNEMLVVNGDKTLVGNGTIHAKKGEYAIVINPNAKLTINGPSVDCESGATNGIYTAEAATFVFDAGTIKNTAGHGVRVLGTSTFNGGGIDTVGTNWIMIDENAATTITKGEFKDADEIGIISGANSTLDISGDVTLDTAVDNLVYAAGTTNINGGTYTGHIDYAFYNSGVMNISNISMSGAKGLGYIQNVAGAKMNLNNVTFNGSKTDYIYNLGMLTADGLTLGDCTNSAIENTGSKANITLKNVTAGKIGASFLLNKKANATLENVEVEEVTAYMVYNRAANLNATGIKVAKVGGTAFLNDYVDAKSTADIGLMNISNFEIGEVTANGLRSNGGSITLKDGSFGICQNHALYIKAGKLDCDTVKFAGAADTKVVIQIGYKTSLKAKAEFKNCDITGGARGLVNYATTTIENSNFHDIQSGGTLKAGAALKNTGTMTITGTRFTGNKALSSGGAIYNTGKLTLGSGNVFSGNSSATSGGAIANGKEGTLKITGGTITNNRATNYAGGIYNSGKLTFSGATVSGNYAVKGGGGIENTGSASISGGTFTGNRSGSTGGGIYNGSKGTMTISGVTVSGNSSSSDKSAGGVYNLGKMTIKSGSFTGNTAGTYGGAISNGINSSGTTKGNLTISGGYFNGNTATNAAGGALYNRGICTISGGNFNGNTINSEKNGKNIYNSGELTIKGGKANDASGKPYDIYTYNGNVNFSGSPSIGSIYKAAASTVTIAGKLTPSSRIQFYMGSYAFGQKAFYGSSSNIASYKKAFDLSHHDVSTTSDSTEKYVDNDGVINAPYAKEAELWRDGEKLTTTTLEVAASSAQNGDTIKIIGDVNITKYISLSCFSKTTIDTYKTIYIKGDGAAHTITVDTGSDCAFYIAASTGDGGTGTSASGYYRSSVAVFMDATNLTFQGTGDMGSAAFYVSGPATLNITGGTFDGFSNVATESATKEQTHSTGKNGGVMSIGSSANVTIDGATFSSNMNTGSGGAAIYNNGKLTVNNSTFVDNYTAYDSGKNGGAIYVTATGTLSSNNNLYKGNTANNGGAVYVYGGVATSVGDTYINNDATGSASSLGQSIYATSKGDEQYATLGLSDVTVTGAFEGQYGVYVKPGNQFVLRGTNNIDNIKVDALPVLLDSDIAGSSKITIPESMYNGGTQVFSGATTGCNAAFTVNDGALSLDDDGVLVGTLYRAAIGSTEYETIDDALAAAVTGDTIKLLRNVKYDTSDRSGSRTKATVIDKNITLDINGFELTSEGKYQMFRVESGAIFTLKDSVGTGKVTPCTDSYGGRFVTVQSGTFNMESGLITGASTSSSGGAGAVNVAASGVFNMTGGKIENCSATVGKSGGGMAGAVAVAGTFNFSGGEITNCSQEAEGASNIQGAGILNISGTAKVDATYNVTTTNITGGYFKTDVSTDCAAGYRCVADSTFAPKYTYKVEVDPTVSAVIEVNGTEYNSYAAAITAIGSLTGDINVKLLDNVTVSSPYTVAVGQNITFDLNGKTVTGIGTSTSSTAARFMVVEGTLTIDDTSAAKTGTFTNFGPATSCNGAIWNKGTTNIKAGIFDMGQFKNGAVVYNGATGNDDQKNATTNITGGTLKSTAGTTLYAYYGTINVSGGFLSDSIANGTNGKVNITGGYFPSNTLTVAEGYEFQADSTYPGYAYKVVSTTKVAQVGDTQYATFDDALTAANGVSSATIKLLADITDVDGAAITGNVTIDLAGNKITPAATAETALTVSGSLTVKDSVGGGSIASGTSAAISAATGATVNVQDNIAVGTAGKTALSGAGSFSISGNARISGTSLPETCTITGGYFQFDVASKLTSDYKCVADTTYEGYGYKVKSLDGYEQPGGTDGKDITDVDPFDETAGVPQ